MIERVRMLRKTVMGAALALSSLVLGSGSDAFAQAKTIPQMTVVIYNNTGFYNIYPLISFPGATPDKWLQAFFEVPNADIDTKTYPNASTTRMFVNCCGDVTKGIPPGGSVTVKLPLYTPLVDSIDPTKTDQLIEWWQGGNLNIYQSTDGKPPQALQNLWKEGKTPVTFKGGPARCLSPATCTIFSATTGNPLPNAPQQLVEWTLGATDLNPDRLKPGKPFFLLNTTNVDYDVSYVNTAYLPVVVEAVGNDLQGWVGAAGTVGIFYQTVSKFLKSDLAKGWPLLIGADGKVVQGKIPSALEIFQQSVGNYPKDPSKDGQWENPPKFSPSPQSSPPIRAMIQRWVDCQPNKPGNTDQICKYLNDNVSPKDQRNDVTSLLLANFDNYLTYYSKNGPKGDWGCNQKIEPHPPSKPITNLQLLQHIYGWQVFNEHCNSGANQLYDTPGWNDPKNTVQNYQLVKNGFDNLQYWQDVLQRKYGVFHPYVTLIHGPDYLNAPYTYAYSVDDAVGNVQTDGTGVVVAVGGTQRLPNPDHATPDIHFDFAYKDPNIDPPIVFTKYGRCTKTPDTPVNPNFTSFAVPIGVTKKFSDCPVSFLDSLGRTYQIQLSADPNLTPDKWVKYSTKISGDPEARKPVQASCSRNTNPDVRDQWCAFAYAFQQTLNDARSTIEYHVNMRAPPKNTQPQKNTQ